MWKRIHSNRDPRDTLYSEVRKEFSPYFQLASNKARLLISRYSRMVYGMMIMLLLISAGLSFTMFRYHDKKRDINVRKAATPISAGFDRIIDAAAGIKETFALKKLVDSLTVQKALSSRDSLTLDSALDRLKAISKH